MKKLFSITLIIAFFFQSTSQLWIWASFEINRSYIAANLCINRFESIPVCKGSCYLEKKLNEDNKQQQKIPDLKTKEINLFCQAQWGQIFEDIFPATISPFAYHNTSFISSSYLQAVFRPPSNMI